jgi:hypothetical protein
VCNKVIATCRCEVEKVERFMVCRECEDEADRTAAR